MITEETYQPVESGVWPNDTVEADTTVQTLDDDEITEICREIRTYKTITGASVEQKITQSRS